MNPRRRRLSIASPIEHRPVGEVPEWRFVRVVYKDGCVHTHKFKADTGYDWPQRCEKHNVGYQRVETYDAAAMPSEEA